MYFIWCFYNINSCEDLKSPDVEKVYLFGLIIYKKKTKKNIIFNGNIYTTNAHNL